MNFNGMDMGKLMQQAQKMQEEMQQKQNELNKKTFEFSVGGGAVNITLNGAYEVLAIKISDELMKSGDVEMLQDLILSAFNGAVKQINAASESSFGNLGNLKNFF